MDKILISNSFKNLLQSLGAKTSNSNYAVPVVTAGSGTTAGTPQGYMDMASLASVLGGYLLFPVVTATGTSTEPFDFNNAAVNKITFPDSNARTYFTNAPHTGALTESYIITIGQGVYPIQIFIERDNIYYRYKVTTGWRSWKTFTLTAV